MNTTYKPQQAISRGYLALELDKDATRRFCALRMGHGALTMVKEGKKVPWDIFDCYMAREI